jgi:tetratricopeptide (TPR) repeat protein
MNTSLRAVPLLICVLTGSVRQLPGQITSDNRFQNTLTAERFPHVAERATAARQANQLPEAIALYREAVNLNPKWEEGWWFLGSLLYDTDQYSAARDSLARVVDLDPKAYPAWGLLGLCEFEIGDYEASLSHIQRALEAASNPQGQMEGVLRYHEAVLLTRAGEFDAALQKYGWFARQGIQNPEMISAVGLAALRSPLLPKEIAAGERELYNSAGKAAFFSLSGDYQSARKAMEELVASFPKAHHVHYLYGSFLMATDPKAAMDEFRRELELTPSSGAANAMLAWMLLQHGDASGAFPYAEAAAKYEPASSMARYMLGRCLAEEGKLEAGIAQLERAQKADPLNLDTHISLATAYSRAGRPQDARRERLRSLELWNQEDATGQH